MLLAMKQCALGPALYPSDSLITASNQPNQPTNQPITQQISMCRAAFHTGYVPHGILRLSKSQLDGACLDGRFDQVGTGSMGNQ